MMNAREAALRAVSMVRKSGAWSESILDSMIKSGSIKHEDVTLANNIALGTVQNMTYLDFILASYCTMPLKKLHPVTLDILRISAYQILFLDRIPDSAAVSEAVNMTKKQVNTRASGMVNAVLRKVSQNKHALPKIEFEDEAQALSVRYSHDVWLVRYLIERLGRDGAEAFLRYDNEKPKITVHTNTLRITPTELEERFSEESVLFAPFPRLDGCYTVSVSGGVDKLPSFCEGLLYVQDASAHMVSEIAGVKSGDSVLDVCAAPGGKSIAAAIKMENAGTILACDIHENKLGRIRDNAVRLGITILETACRDASVYYEEYDSAFDTVIADVPCSGFGVIAKKPEIRYKSDGDTKSLPAIQKSILVNVSRYVKRGGCLIYSTCTVLSRENEDIVTEFLRNHEDFALESFSVFGEEQEIGMMTFFPHIHGTDGFFIAKLRRKQ